MELIIRSNHMQEVEGVTAEYPYVLNRADSETMRVPWHWHEELEFDRVVQGHILLRIAGRSIEFGSGEGFFINSNVLAAIEGDPDTILKSHLFHPVFLSGHYHSIFETKYICD